MAVMTGNNSIDALLAGDAYRWNAGAAVGTAVTITYSFPTTIPGYYSATAAERSGYAAVTAAMQTGIKQALACYEAVANVKFVFDATGNGQINFDMCNMGSSSSAYSYFAMGGAGASKLAGDVWYNVNYAPNLNQTAGTYGFLTTIHELGHAMGLKHPGDYDAGGASVSGPFLPTATDSTQYTVMSYHGGTLTSANPQTLQLYDIQALQYLYGANTAYHTGDDVYTVSNAAPVTETIWDAGGVNTLSAANQTHRAIIDLGAGRFSSIGVDAYGRDATNNVAIAYNVKMQNAVGGSGNDSLIGNDLDNLLTGGAGNDTIAGGGGNDTVVFAGKRADYRLTLSNGVLTSVDGVSGRDGTDTISGVEYLRFVDGTVSVASLGAAANRAPTVAAAPRAVGVGKTVAVSSLFTASDADGDAILRYKIVDPTGAGAVMLNGATNLSTVPGEIQVAAADLGKLVYLGAGTETLKVSAFDGVAWGAAADLRITNAAPTVAAPATVAGRNGATVAVSSLFTAVDPDGDALSYRIVDAPGGGKINLNGAVNHASAVDAANGVYQVAGADLGKLTYTENGGDRLTFSAYDGLQWSAAATEQVLNSAPVVGAKAGTTTLKVGQTVAVSSLFAAGDQDGDALTWEITDPAGGGKVNLNGAVNLASATDAAKGLVKVSGVDFAKLTYTDAGSETLRARVYDGAQYSGYANATVANAAPTVSVVQHANLRNGTTVALSSLVAARDPEGDALTSYRIFDPAGGGKLNLNGAANIASATDLAQGVVQVSGADFGKLTYTQNGSETLAVYAFDGGQWSAPAYASEMNFASDVFATGKSVATGQTVRMTDLFSFTNYEGDALQFRFSDPAGAGHIDLHGAANLASATDAARGMCVVSGAQLGLLTYVGGGHETLTASAWDGGQWGRSASLFL